MHSSQWIEFLRKVPPNRQDGLLFATSAGLEISLQAILQIDDNYLLMRGRQGGTTETGRVFCIPFDQINYVMFNRELKEPELREMFGDILVVEKASPLTDEPPAESQANTDTAPIQALPTPSPEAVPGRTSLRERLRARLGLSSPSMNTKG